MSRIYVKEIETNLKVGAHVALGERTLIVGPPRSGKSTITNAVEAAGSGSVSDVAGRSVLAKDVDLSALGDAPTLFAVARLSNGERARWSLEKGHRAKRTGPEITFPLREVREALLGSPEKARRWILTHGEPIEWSEVTHLLPEPLLPRLRRVTWGNLADLPTPERLAAAIDMIRAKARELKSVAKPPIPAGPPPTDEEVRAAEEAVARLATAVSPSRLAAVRAEVTARRARVVQLEEELAGRERILAALPPLQPVSELARSALVVIEHLAHAGAPQCVICGAAPLDVGTLRQRATHARAAIEGGLRAEDQRRETTAAISRVKGEIAAERPALASAEREEKRLAAQAQEVTAIGDPDAARIRLSDLHARRAAFQAIQRAEAEALAAEQEALAWSQLADALVTILGTLVERARTQFEARVQALLPATYMFGIDLLDGEREVLRIGLRSRKDQPVRVALSGVEWATVTAALAVATAPTDRPAVIIPEDRAHSPETLTEVMRAFSGGDAQVVIASPVEPVEPIRGWTVVYTGPAAEPPLLRSTLPTPRPATVPVPVPVPAAPGTNSFRDASLAKAAERARAIAEEPVGVNLEHLLKQEE